MRSVPNPGELADLARALELEAYTARLLTHLFPEDPAWPERPGRYRSLETAVDSDGALRVALDNGDDSVIGRAWQRYVDLRNTDIDLHHTLAVLYRERALTPHGAAGPPGERLLTATLLWLLLLATDDFWTRFDGDLDRASLSETIVRELCELHASQGATALVAGRSATARRHLMCLDACRSDSSRVRDMLADQGILYGPRVNEDRFRRLSGIAADAIDRWCADVIADAERRVKDPDAIAGLPEGIREAYATGIDRVKALVRLGVSLPSALFKGLEWHNNWCWDLYSTNDRDTMADVLRSAEYFADRLKPLVEPEQGHRAENQALSRHLMYRGYATEDNPAAARHFEESLEWNPSNDNAAKLLAQTYVVIGDELAGKGEFAEAFEYGRKAQDLLPGDPRVQRFVREMTTMKAEERNIARIGTAAQCLDDKDYDRALRELEQIPSGSPVASTAKKLRMEAYLRRGVAAANQSRDYTAAASDLLEALTLADNEKNENFINEQLNTVLANQKLNSK